MPCQIAAHQPRTEYHTLQSSTHIFTLVILCACVGAVYYKYLRYGVVLAVLAYVARGTTPVY